MAILARHEPKGFGTPRPARRRWFGSAPTLLACLLALALAGNPARSQPATPTEYELKAAFLYNFLLFVEWPRDAFAETNAPIRIGIVGSDPFGAVLDETMRGKTVAGHPVMIQRIKDQRGETNCHLLFIGRLDKRPVGQVLTAVGNSSILTVSEQEHFPETGGIIGLTMDGKKVRFEVNLAAAERSRLKIDPKLLKLAKAVRGPKGAPVN
jgi:hypothetical protein